MTETSKHEGMVSELKLAIGLIWRHLKVRQFDDAYRLARGCLCVWPGDERLVMMAAYAAVELDQSMDEEMLNMFRHGECDAWEDWINLVLRRRSGSSALHGDACAA